MTREIISAKKKTWAMPEVILLSSAYINAKSNHAANESSYVATGGGKFVNPPNVTLIPASIVTQYLS